MSSEPSRAATWRARATLMLIATVVTLAVLRFIIAVNSGTQFDRGDFYATMPPAYAEQLNPVLWNSRDLSGSWVFQQPVYLYGPTQYLSIAPLVYFFDSYAQISHFLLFFYGTTVVVSALGLRSALHQIEPLSGRTGLLIFSATIGFFPLLQAYVQREFEVFIFALTVAGLYFLLRRREWIAGALFGYITWFKFLPLLWLGLLVMRRWAAAVAAFIAVTVAIWLAAFGFFGLGNFDHLWDLAGQELSQSSTGAALCAPFVNPDLIRFANSNLTSAGIRFALCRFGSWYPWLPVSVLYFALLLLLLATFLIAFWRIERHANQSPRTDLWRRALEASVVVIMTCGFFYSHYYYLSLLAVPIAVLIARYSTTASGWARPLALIAAYAFLTAFIIPPSVSSGMVGEDVFRIYMRLSLYFYGEIILIALVFYEYWLLSKSAPSLPA